MVRFVNPEGKNYPKKVNGVGSTKNEDNC